MSIEINIITDKSAYDAFVMSKKPHTFLQSSAWADASAALHSRYRLLGAYQGSQLVATALTLTVRSRRGTFLHIPHGPIMDHADSEIMDAFVLAWKKFANEDGALFIRVSPIIALESSEKQIFTQHGFRPAPMHMHAETLWLLDVSPEEDVLLSNMRKNCRYAIRKAERDGVKIRRSVDSSDLGLFYEIYRQTAARQNFSPFSFGYIRSEFEAFRAAGRAMFFFGEFQEKTVSAALILFTESEAFYHQGASTPVGEGVSVMHLVQWEIIRESRRRGLAFYNFWGVSPADQPAHPWAGLSNFKRGFGGFELQLVHAQDLVLSHWYWPGWVLERFRRWRRAL